jgi:hypothetical protein
MSSTSIGIVLKPPVIASAPARWVEVSLVIAFKLVVPFFVRFQRTEGAPLRTEFWRLLRL